MINNLFSNEGLPEWAPLVCIIVVIVGYVFYRLMLKREGRKEMSSRGFMDRMYEPVTESEYEALSRLPGSGIDRSGK